MSLCASIYMCFVVTCWERADLLALVCSVCCECVTFPLVSWVRCGTWLYRFLIIAPLLTFMWIVFVMYASCWCVLCCCVCSLWSPAGKGLTSWLSCLLCCVTFPNVFWSTSELRARFASWSCFTPFSKIFYWPFQGSTSFVDLLGFFSVLCLLCLCVRLVICALSSPAGKGWPLGSHLWCIIVSLSLSHWYPGAGVVLDCIDSWSLHPYLLLCWLVSSVIRKQCKQCLWQGTIFVGKGRREDPIVMDRKHFIKYWRSFEYRACADNGQDPNSTNSGPSLDHQRNAIKMAFCWRSDDCPTLNTGLLALWFSKGSGPVLLRNPIALWFSREGGWRGPDPLVPPLVPRMFVTWEDLNQTVP